MTPAAPWRPAYLPTDAINTALVALNAIILRACTSAGRRPRRLLSTFLYLLRPISTTCNRVPSCPCRPLFTILYLSARPSANHFVRCAGQATCDNKVSAGAGGPVTDAECQAVGGPASRFLTGSTANCVTAPCDMAEGTNADIAACCLIPKCDDPDAAEDITCPLGKTLVATPATVAQTGPDLATASCIGTCTDSLNGCTNTGACSAIAAFVASPLTTNCPTGSGCVFHASNEATCCRAKIQSDCTLASTFYCAEHSDTATDPCLAGTGAADACDTCPTQLNEPGAPAFDGTGAASACLENTCAALDAEGWAAKGVVLAGLDPTWDTISDITAAATTPAAGWKRQTQTGAGTALPVGTCTGTATDTTTFPSCPNAFTTAVADGEASTDCPAGCAYLPPAAITCDNTNFVVTGTVGLICAAPTTAPAGTSIAGMTCSNFQTGSITCSALHTCVTATHHASATGIDIDGADNIHGTSDDGVACLTESAGPGSDPLTLIVADTVGAADAAGCSINVCSITTVPTGYVVAGTDVSTAVPGLGAATCNNAGGAQEFTVTSTSFFGVATCTGTVGAAVEGKVANAVDDCPTWAAWARTNQPADCPTGCTYDNTAATVTCAQGPSDADLTNAFVYTGCSQAKCNDITSDDNQASTAFAACSKGMAVLSDLAVACADGTCDTWDCCTEDDGCAAMPNPGFDLVAGNTDDGENPCFGTNSACVDVPAPGVGNTCTCCDGANSVSLTTACGGSIGFFGADVTSVDAADSASVAAVQGSCTACTPIANSAEAHTPPSVATDVDEADKMVTCTAADNSRAVTCVTGAITVDNTANGVSDVCRLECPFTEVVALIERLHIHTDRCAAVDLTTGSPGEGAQTAACEAVEGCYYTPCVDQPGTGPCGVNAGTDVIATCRPIYAGCNDVADGVAGTQAACAAGPMLSGTDNVLASLADAVPVTSADDVSACTYFLGADGLAAGADAADDTCRYTPAATAYTNTIERCDALLATNWAHDLRDSCDATAACPLHGAIGATTPGMIAMVKAVYATAGAAPLGGANGGDTWAAGASPRAAGGTGATTLAALAALGGDSALAAAYFLHDGDANTKTDWEVCVGIRDAVLAAPTCSSGAGR